MYQTILIDDEEIVRKGLLYFLDWHALGFHIVTDFEDGKEAIEFLQANPVDVVLTDIHMAETSGLAVAKWVYHNSPQTKVVIISGYKEFEYAKQAIEYNVEHYLLKPTKYDDMLQVFTMLKKTLDEQAAQHSMRQEEQRRLKELLPLLHEQFVLDVAMGVFRNEEEMVKRGSLIQFDADLQHSPCCLLDIEMAHDASAPAVAPEAGILHAIEHIFKSELTAIRYYSIYRSDRRIRMLAIAIQTKEMTLFRRYLQERNTFIADEIRRLFGFELYVDDVEAFPGLNVLSAYNKPLQLVFHEEDGKTCLETEEYDKLLQKYKILFSHISEGNLAEVHHLFDRFMDEFSQLPISNVHHLVMDLFAHITQALLEHGILSKEMQKKRYDYHQVVNMKALPEIRAWSKSFLSELMNMLSVQQETCSNDSAELAKAYIMKHFDQELSLDDVAHHVFLHPIYFSRMFKQATGMNYIDFLKQVRVQKAIELLESGQYKIYEIPQLIGYKNREYFTRLFKQATGLSPKKYLHQFRLNRTSQ